MGPCVTTAAGAVSPTNGPCHGRKCRENLPVFSLDRSMHMPRRLGYKEKEWVLMETGRGSSASCERAGFMHGNIAPRARQLSNLELWEEQRMRGMYGMPRWIADQCAHL